MSDVAHINRCRCSCHRHPGAKHVVACCTRCWLCGTARIVNIGTHRRNECHYESETGGKKA